MTTKSMAKAGNNLPAFLGDNKYADFEDAGMEQADAESFAIPFLRILQSNSPQASKSNGKFIKGAEEGFLYNTVSQDVLDTSDEKLHLVPVYFRRAFMEWKPRGGDGGGGYVAEHDPVTGAELLRTAERDDKNHDILPNGNELSDTRYHYVMLVRADGSFEPLLITMERSQLKNSKRLNTDVNNKRKAKGVPGPALMYSVGVASESKDDNSWWGWDIKYDGLVQDQALFDAAIEFQEQIRAGKTKDATDSLADSEVFDDEEGTAF